MRRCDAVFSKLVRAIGYCEAGPIFGNRSGPYCSGPLQCAHIVSRSYRALRWDKDNAMCLCAAHHMYFTHRPIEWELFCVDELGQDAYDDLKRRALEATRVDYEAVLSSLEAA